MVRFWNVCKREIRGIMGDIEIRRYRSDEITGRVIQCIIHVHQTLGHGFLESVYRRALLIELRKQLRRRPRGLPASQRP
ncbi:MAG: GxxExxY protein [Longimicrobiales bacterium]